MAVDSALLYRQRTLAAKIETTTGTAIALDAASGAVNVFDSSVESAIKMTERDGQGSFAPLAPIPGASEGSAKFKTEVTTSGTATDPFWIGTLLAGCGFAATNSIWYPKTGASATLTIGQFISGQLHSIAGAMGKFTIDFEIGKPGMVSWDFGGVWQSPSSTELLAPTYPTVVPARFAGGTLSLGGTTTYRVGKISISVENTIAMREDMIATDGATSNAYGTGIHSYQITGRKITTKISAEALSLATKNWWEDHRTVTAAALSLVLGSGTNGTITIAAPALVHLDAPGVEDNNGLYRNALSFLNTGTAGGDTELSIKQT